MTVNKGLKQLYYSVFDGTETWVSNVIVNHQERKDLKKYHPSASMPREYAQEYKKFWKKYGNFSPEWGWYYASRNGIIDVKYVPHTIIYTKIDQHFNSRKLGWGFNDKNYYSRIFEGIKQPDTLVRNFGANIFLNSDYKQITPEEALFTIFDEDEVICKPTMESGSGRGIEFWDCHKDRNKIIDFIHNSGNADYTIQRIIRQHKDLATIHANSINTVRICSLLMVDGVHILSCCLRMGVNKSRVDNVTAGGISCGIKADGTLDKYAYNYYTGERFETHPQGFVFLGAKVPSFEKTIELVKKAHPMIPHFRLVSWDIAIDNQGDAVLIEANMRKGGINLHQFSNGPLFGDLTEIVLEEVYNS